MSERQKIHSDIVHLHEAIETITSPLTARNQGIAIHQVPNDPFLNQLGTFKPALFRPRQSQQTTKKTSKKKRTGREKEKGKARQKAPERNRNLSTSTEDAAPGLEPSSSSSSSSSGLMALALPSFSLFASPSSSRRPSSSCSSLSFGNFEHEPWLPPGSGEPVYPPVLEHVAKMNGCVLPRLPTKREYVLTSDGPTPKAKQLNTPNLALYEERQWEITEILEDPTYKYPHCVAELFLSPTNQMDSRVLSLTEIKAVLRLMRARIELRQYQHHSSLPLLILSYISCGEEKDAKCKPARIIQAHHNGQKLMIQYVQLANWVDRKTTPSALDPFVAYFFSEPVMPTLNSSGEKHKRRALWLQGK
ncbi:hypothetical protein BJX63DRAFT_430958 [Aspergillus granulosus]|uniref:Uncharacterized protein n=1 Tax=Aspergillus granulosus TaxID=176169 RepID=A0ABR4HI37_9EURO